MGTYEHEIVLDRGLTFEPTGHTHQGRFDLRPVPLFSVGEAVAKGDLPGHEFRGNQWGGGGGEGEQPQAEQPGGTIGSAERTALKDYAGNGAVPLNRFLRSGKEAFQGQGKELQGRYVTHMDAAFASVAPLEKDIEVYRGIKGNTRLRVGSTFTDKGYASTSTSRSEGEGFGDDGRMVVIRVPKGARVLDMNAQKVARMRSEHEVLLPRGSKFRVVSKEGNVWTAELVTK